MRLAGYRPAQAWVRAGAGLRGDDILLMRFASESRLPYVSIGVFCVRITPAVCRPVANRNGLRYVSFLFRAGRDRHSAFSDVLRLSDFTDSLQVCTFLYGDPDGERGQQRGVSMFLRNHISPAMLSAGNTLGLKCGSRTAAAPDCAKEPSLSGLSSSGSRRGYKCNTIAFQEHQMLVPCSHAA